MTQALHITAAGTWVVGVGPGGVLERLTVNTGGAGSTATLYDGTADGDTVTGNEIGVVSTAAAVTLDYGLTLVNGLVVVTASGSAADLTVIFSAGRAGSLQASAP